MLSFPTRFFNVFLLLIILSGKLFFAINCWIYPRWLWTHKRSSARCRRVFRLLFRCWAYWKSVCIGQMPAVVSFWHYAFLEKQQQRRQQRLPWLWLCCTIIRTLSLEPPSTSWLRENGQNAQMFAHWLSSIIHKHITERSRQNRTEWNGTRSQTPSWMRGNSSVA